ncbi:SRPBCC domain-containing protein, partial [Streptomyces spongiae]
MCVACAVKAGEARVVTLGQTYDSTVEDVWDACTNPERIPRWFLPVSGELRLGGRYQLQGNAGGTIERCEPPRGFGATWEYDGNVSWIELRLAEVGGGPGEGGPDDGGVHGSGRGRGCGRGCG